MSTPAADSQETRRRQRRRRRALKNLRTALADAGDQLTTDWVLQDRDLETLRAEMHEDPGWVMLVAPRDKEEKPSARAPKVPSHRRPGGTVKAPAYPWHPLVVIPCWLVAFVVFGSLLLRALTDDAFWAFTLLALIATLASALYLVAAVDKRVVRRRLVSDRESSTERQEPGNDRPAE